MEPNESLEELFDMLRSNLHWESIAPSVQVAEAGPEVYLYCEFPDRESQTDRSADQRDGTLQQNTAGTRCDRTSLLQLLVGDGPSTPCTALFPPSLPGGHSLVLSLWMARMSDPELLTTNVYQNFDYALRGNTLLIRSDATASSLDTTSQANTQTHPNLVRIATAEVSFGHKGLPSEFRLIYALHRRLPEFVPPQPPQASFVMDRTMSPQALEDVMVQRHREQFRRQNKEASAASKPKNTKKPTSAISRPQPERLSPDDVNRCKAASEELGVRLIAITVDQADSLNNSDTANDAEIFGPCEGGKPEPQRFRADLRAFLAARNRKYRVRTVSGAPLNLFKLMFSVLSRGGIAEVIHEKHFKKVTKELGLGATCTSGAFVLRTEYLDLLHDYEQELAIGKATKAPVTPASRKRNILGSSIKANTPPVPSPCIGLMTAFPAAVETPLSSLHHNFLRTPPSFPSLFGSPRMQPYSDIRNVFGNDEALSFGLPERLEMHDDDRGVQDENNPPKRHCSDNFR